jgi:hypothetical protein
MKRLHVAAIFLVIVFFLSSFAFSQSNNATVGGTVTDPSGALVPGVSLKATNQDTGIVTTVLSNEAGAYNFASLLPGPYKISAELPGFRTQTYSDVRLGTSAQVRLNFTLSVSTVATSVDVTIGAQNLITSSSSSVGEVLPQRQIQDLPLVSNNVLDLIGVMAGVYMTNSPVFGAEQTNFAGVSARDVNVQRDGISINNQRWPNGLDSPTRMNPDLVGEIKLILAPVDAEMGRGNGQVQIQTRSGTNKYSGVAVWNVQNSALDANTWSNNRNQTPNNLGIVRATQPAWRNFHEYNLALGGPIKQNKTFFYALWDQQFILTRNITNPTVLTDCARLGIFRYYDGVNNGNSRQLTVGGSTPQQATVNTDGSPKAPLDANGNPLPLRFLSVFGPLAANPTKNDCSDAQINTSTLIPTGATTSFDANRKQLDKTGFMSSLLGLMPRANSFDNPGNIVAVPNVAFAPDGLNTATHQWLRRAKGADNLFGVGQDNNRRQINVKLDHNFSTNHKLNGSYSYEKDTSDDAALPAWPTGYPGQDIRKPQVLSVGFISTLSSSLLNEARFGLSRTGANTGGAVNRADVGEEVLKLYPQVGGQTVLIGTGGAGLGFQSLAFGSPIQGLGYSSQEVSPRWTYGDTVSWTQGVHAFKFGAEYRMSSTKSTLGGSVQTGANRATATIGNTLVAPVTGIARTGLLGTATTGNQQVAENLLTWLSGSLSGLAQARFINNLSGTWNDFATDPLKIRDIRQNEIGTFFKDDWKVSRDLTLNLGVRWDYYGVPWENNGLTTALNGGGYALFGRSGRSFTDWMKPGTRADDTEIIYVGPNSPNPDQAIHSRDLNNFGPAVGFAWQVPWGGKGKTTVRGGYQVQFLGGGRGFVLDTAIGNPPGSSNTANCITCTASFFSIEQLVANPSLVPVQPTVLPKATGTIIPVTDRTGLLNAFDPSYLSPSVQNLTLSVTRNLTSKLTLDMRYIGTLSRKLWANLDLNAPNFLYNGLKEAFDAARSGGESQLLNDMFAGLNIAGTGCATNTGATTPCAAVGSVNSAGVLQTGAMHLRGATQGGALGQMRVNLANGNYAALANTLNILTNTGATNNGNNPALAGSVLRNSGKFPENFIKTNPQFSTAVMETNPGHSNYHSVQAQVSLRPTAGLSMQGTYTFSRNLGQAPGGGANGTGSAFTDPADRMADYTLLPSHRQHTLVSYGTFELPVGPNKLLFKNASGIWARIAEGWQASWVANLSSGSPANVTAQSMLYALGVPDIVGPFDIKNLNYFWKEGNAAGNIFADANGAPIYGRVKDPQCLNPSIVVSYMSNVCTLNAVTNAGTGQVLLQAPLPGKRGTLGQNRFENVGSWTADMAIQKRVRISESKNMTIRLDATNVFNHPTPGTAGLFSANVGGSDLSLQGTNPFGAVTSKSGQRRFQLKARLDF